MEKDLFNDFQKAKATYKYLMVEFYQLDPKRSFMLFNIKTKKVLIHHGNLNKEIHLGFNRKNTYTNIILSTDDLVRQKFNKDRGEFIFINKPYQGLIMTFTNEKERR